MLRIGRFRLWIKLLLMCVVAAMSISLLFLVYEPLSSVQVVSEPSLLPAAVHSLDFKQKLTNRETHPIVLTSERTARQAADEQTDESAERNEQTDNSVNTSVLDIKKDAGALVARAIIETRQFPVEETAGEVSDVHVAEMPAIVFPELESPLVSHLQIVSFADTSTLAGLAAMMNSVIIHNAGANTLVQFYLGVSDNRSAEIRMWLHKQFPGQAIDLVGVDDNSFGDSVSSLFRQYRQKFAGFNNTRAFRPELLSPLNLARFWIPMLFPTLRGEFVYIDTDVIVTGPLGPVLGQQFDDTHWAAFFTSNVRGRRIGKYLDTTMPELAVLGLQADAPVIIGGIFVSSIDMWVKHDITSLLLRWLLWHLNEMVKPSSRKLFSGITQPPMIIVFHNHTIELDATKYAGDQVDPKLFPNAQAQTEILFFHWNGRSRSKPWLARTGPSFSIWETYEVKVEPQLDVK